MHLRRLGPVVALVLGCGLVAVPSTIAHAAFPGSPGRIVYVSHRSGAYDIWTVRPDGTDNRNLTKDSAADADPTYSPDGQQIAWSRNGAIWVMSADGNNAHRVADTSGADTSPAFSPSGRRLVWSANGVLHIVDVNGARAHSIHVTGTQPAWSPDGRWIAYTFVDAQRGLYVIRKVHPDGTRVRTLTARANAGSEPDWSPDARHIVFLFDRTPCGACATEIHVMRADGSSGHRLDVRGTYLYDPVYSPTGTRIAFTFQRYGPGATNRWEIHTYNLATRRTQAVTTSGMTKLPAAMEPGWQPR